ncbi:hypothetical protein DFH08DRAFT_944689 [Mycena albidolilacea]|uniref:Uncharacterized protein n=1 Tax=Mycena albidolilacea TaxID=1033008 RepID=A0AAD7EAB7_9AGAR|nr:hypothetical protein DFH08DRAFT_944689 [Mycena albidolilacea]
MYICMFAEQPSPTPQRRIELCLIAKGDTVKRSARTGQIYWVGYKTTAGRSHGGTGTGKGKEYIRMQKYTLCTGGQSIYEMYDTRGEILGWTNGKGEAWISGISLPAKNNGENRKAEEIVIARHNHIPTTTNSYRTTRSSQEHPTITWAAGRHVSQKGETAEVPLLRPLSTAANICEIHMKKCRTRNMLHETRRARAESPDGTPVQRVERVKKGWGDIRASTGKRWTATHDLHHTETPAPQYLSHRNMQERTPIATIEKTVWSWRVRHSTALGLRARLRAQRRDSRAVVLVMMEEEVRPKRRGKEQGGVGGQVDRRVMRVSACAEEQGEEAKKGGRPEPGLGRETRSGWWRGKDGASANKKTGSWSELVRAMDAMEERRRGGSWSNREVWGATVRVNGADSRVASRTGNGGGSPWCERAKEEVELLEMEKRAAAGGRLGGTESRVHIDTRARSASKECHLACTGSACRCARTSAYRWTADAGMKRGVYDRRCEDGIAEYARVVVHAARDTLAWSTTGCGVGVGGEGAPEVLARRFERHRPRIAGLVLGLRNEKMRRCKASSQGLDPRAPSRDSTPRGHGRHR